ncbi:MAG: dienelactone hydrolase family protein [Allosphingosinicella sp.]
MDPLKDFTNFPFTHGKWTHKVYRKGSGPPVIVIHEMPGITPAVAKFGRRVADDGFTVFMPSLFGTPGAEPTRLAFATQFIRLCIHREFELLAKDHPSPVTDWLRGLAAQVFSEIPGRGVGVIGMCITGNFALTMALDANVVAPVLAEPSLPYSLFRNDGIEAAVHASPEALENIRQRHRADGFKVLGFRFEGDELCRRARFETLEKELGPAFDGQSLPDASAASRRDNPNNKPHSVFTSELIDEAGEPTGDALRKVLGFFAEKLK